MASLTTQIPESRILKILSQALGIPVNRVRGYRQIGSHEASRRFLSIDDQEKLEHLGMYFDEQDALESSREGRLWYICNHYPPFT